MFLSAHGAGVRVGLVALQLTVGVALLPGCDSDSQCERDCEHPAADEDAGGAEPIDRDAGPKVDLEEPLPDAGMLPYACEAGVMDGVSKRFALLEPGETIPIGGTGQAGLVARLALRCTPLGESPALEMARVDLLLINPFNAISAPRKSRPRNYDLVCDSDGVCDLIPILVEISHLAKLPELEGLPVRVDVSVRGVVDESELLGQARSHGVFQRQ